MRRTTKPKDKPLTVEELYAEPFGLAHRFHKHEMKALDDDREYFRSRCNIWTVIVILIAFVAIENLVWLFDYIGNHWCK